MTTHAPALRRALRSAAALTLAAALATSLAACGDSDSDGSPSATETASNGDVFNDADVAFATDMIQHHAQALAMVDLAAGRPLDPEVQALTEQIRDAQAPEIETMTDWLTAWDQKIPATVRDHTHADMGGMDGDDTGSDMPGMMTAEQMGELEHASDADFQDRWLQMMIEHHEGAIQMARDEQADGTFDGATALAKDIESSQQQEIDTMTGMLG